MKWSTDEEHKLHSLIQMNVPTETIARILKRSMVSVYNKIHYINKRECTKTGTPLSQEDEQFIRDNLDMKSTKISIKLLRDPSEISSIKKRIKSETGSVNVTARLITTQDIIKQEKYDQVISTIKEINKCIESVRIQGTRDERLTLESAKLIILKRSGLSKTVILNILYELQT